MLKYIEKKGFIHDNEYAILTDRAKATRAKDFKKLIEMGLIEKHGQSRATYYNLKEHQYPLVYIITPLEKVSITINN